MNSLEMINSRRVEVVYVDDKSTGENHYLSLFFRRPVEYRGESYSTAALLLYKLLTNTRIGGPPQQVQWAIDTIPHTAPWSVSVTELIDTVFSVPEMQDMLKGTQGIIQYLNPHPILGIGGNRSGRNMYGFALMKKRDELRRVNLTEIDAS